MERSKVVTLYKLTLVTVMMFAAGMARADEIVWAINASNGNPHIDEIDVTTGTLVTDFIAPTSDPVKASADGRAIGINSATGVIYYGFANVLGIPTDGNIYETNAAGQDLGVLFTAKNVAGATLNGVQTITFDGTNLWVTDNSTTIDGNLYEYSVTGTLLATISGLPKNPIGNVDGVENLGNGLFIVNNGDGVSPYDLYKLTGSSLTKGQSAFLNPAAHCGAFCGTFTGVAFDGTHYFVSDPTGYGGGTTGLIMEFDTSGNWVTNISLPTGKQPEVQCPPPSTSTTCVGWNIEDLASVGNTSNPPTPAVPEPASVVLLGSVVLGVCWYSRRRSVRKRQAPWPQQ